MEWIWLVLVGLFGVGGGTSVPDPPVVPDAVPSELVVQWSQGSYDEVPTTVPSQVLDTATERDAFLDRLPAALPVEAVEQVDLATTVLVVGGYHSCQQSSYVVATTAGPTLGVTETPEGLACGWSPYTVDVRAVPRS